MKKVQFNFNTLSGPQQVIMTVAEALSDSTIRNHVSHVIKIAEEGAVGATFNHPLLGKIEINMVEAA